MGKGSNLRRRRQGLRSGAPDVRLLNEGLLLHPGMSVFILVHSVTSLTPSKYECLVDRNAENNEPEDLIQQTFFGELQRVVQLNLPQSLEIHQPQDETVLLAHIKTCDVEQADLF